MENAEYDHHLEVKKQKVVKEASLSSWSCSICEVKTTCEQALQDHFNGKKHKAKEEKLKDTANEWRCTLCNLDATSERALKEHFAGKKHKAKESNASLQVSMTDEEKAVKEIKKGQACKSNGAASSELKAEEEGTEQKMQELSLGRKKLMKHNACMETLEEKIKAAYPKFWCKLCQVETSSGALMEEHIRGEEHFEMLKKRGGGLIIMSTKPEDF